MMETYWLLGTKGELERCETIDSADAFPGVAEPAFLSELA